MRELLSSLGLRATAQWSGGTNTITVHVYASGVLQTTAVVSAMTVQTAYALDEDASGRWWLSWTDGTGAIVRWYSEDSGASWTLY